MTGCQAGCTRVQNQILNHWDPQTYNAGCYNPASVLDDGHTPSPHALGEAFDIGIEVPFRGRSSTGQAIFLWLVANTARLGIVQVIYDEQIWTPAKGLHSYTVNPHHDHIHVQLNPVAARNPSLTAEPFPGAGGATTPTQETPVTEAEIQRVVLLTVEAVNGTIEAARKSVIGTLQTNMKAEWIPAIIAGTAKATGADPKVIADAVAHELAEKLDG